MDDIINSITGFLSQYWAIFLFAIVLIILIAAGWLIYDRVGIIMDYPQQIAEDNKELSFIFFILKILGF